MRPARRAPQLARGLRTQALAHTDKMQVQTRYTHGTKYERTSARAQQPRDRAEGSAASAPTPGIVAERSTPPCTPLAHARRQLGRQQSPWEARLLTERTLTSSSMATCLQHGVGAGIGVEHWDREKSMLAACGACSDGV